MNYYILHIQYLCATEEKKNAKHLKIEKKKRKWAKPLNLWELVEKKNKKSELNSGKKELINMLSTYIFFLWQVRWLGL